MSELTKEQKADAAKLSRICGLLGWKIDNYRGRPTGPTSPSRDSLVLTWGYDIIGYALWELWRRGKWDVSRRYDGSWCRARIGETGWTDHAYADTKLDAIIAALEKMQASEVMDERRRWAASAAQDNLCVASQTEAEQRFADLEARVAALEGKPC